MINVLFVGVIAINMIPEKIFTEQVMSIAVEWLYFSSETDTNK